MTPAEARIKAAELNRSGKNRHGWFYYPTYHIEKYEWFVMRRLKTAKVETAVYIDGTISIRERDVREEK